MLMKKNVYTATITFSNISGLWTLHNDPEYSEKKNSFQNKIFEMYKENKVLNPIMLMTSRNPVTFEIDIIDKSYCSDFEKIIHDHYKCIEQLHDFKLVFNKKNYEIVDKNTMFDNFLPDISKQIDPDYLKMGGYNNMGYRCPNFREVDWANSIVMFGCSSSLCPVLPEEKTVANLLEEKLGTRVINLSVSGSSIGFMWMLCNQLKAKIEVLPKAVICNYTDLSRTTIFNERGIDKLGPWVVEENEYSKNLQDYFLTYAEHYNSLTWAKMFQLSIRDLWAQTKLHETTQFPHTSKYLDIECLPTIDYGWDNVHHGPETAKERAILLRKWIESE